MDTNQPVIDTHVHLWDPTRLRYDWHAELPSLDRPFLLAEFEEATRGLPIEGFVFVECDCAVEQSLDEVAMISELAAADSRLKGIVAQAPLEKGEAVRDHLVALAEFPLVKGVRRITQGEADVEFCNQPGFVAGVHLLSEFGFTCDLCINHQQLAATLRLVRNCSEVTFILDHLGKPNICEQVREPWASELGELAALPNVICKFSGVVTEADHQAWSPDDLRFYLDHAIECFTPHRMIFGGDWPVVTLAASYSRWFEVASDAISQLSAAEQASILFSNAREVYRLK